MPDAGLYAAAGNLGGAAGTGIVCENDAAANGFFRLEVTGIDAHQRLAAARAERGEGTVFSAAQFDDEAIEAVLLGQTADMRLNDAAAAQRRNADLP